MRDNIFVIKKGSMLFNRVGPLSAQKQTHRKGNTAPVRRGIWCFPYPIDDPFFYSHIYFKQLPLHLHDKNRPSDDNREELDKWFDERDKAYTRAIKRNPVKRIWWNKPFYSRLNPFKTKVEASWFLHTNAKNFSNIAMSNLRTWNRFGGTLYQIKYSADHLETFLPMVPSKQMPDIIY